MTRATQFTQAVGAMRKARPAPSSTPEPPSLAFSFKPGSDNSPLVDLAARRDAARDRLDAERWLDEGGSVSSEAVTR